MRRWGLPPAAGRFPGDPRPLGGHAEAFFPHTTCGGAVLWRASLAGRVCGSFPPSHSKTRRTKISSDPVPPGTPKLFTFHFSLFTILFFRPKPGEGENKGIPTQFSGDAREPLSARAILSHLYAVCGHPESGLFSLNPFGTVFNPNGTIHRSPVDFRLSLT